MPQCGAMGLSSHSHVRLANQPPRNAVFEGRSTPQPLSPSRLTSTSSVSPGRPKPPHGWAPAVGQIGCCRSPSRVRICRRCPTPLLAIGRDLHAAVCDEERDRSRVGFARICRCGKDHRLADVEPDATALLAPCPVGHELGRQDRVRHLHPAIRGDGLPGLVKDLIAHLATLEQITVLELVTRKLRRRKLTGFVELERGDSHCINGVEVKGADRVHAWELSVNVLEVIRPRLVCFKRRDIVEPRPPVVIRARALRIEAGRCGGVRAATAVVISSKRNMIERYLWPRFLFESSA